MRIFKSFGTLLPVAQAFILASILVVTVILLISPAATDSAIKILEALPPFLTALAAFILATHSKGKGGPTGA